MGNSIRKILLVDDNPDLLVSLKTYLSIDHERYRLLTAADAHEALDILERNDICLVVSDIIMPGMSGLQLFAEIRTRYPQIEVIFMTGYATDEMRREIRQNACLHFFEKPFKFKDLRQLIARQIAKQEEGFAGTLNNIQLTDLIQMCCLSFIDMVIRVKKRDQHGDIIIRDGKIIHAACGKEVGEKAFFQILSWQSGSFETLSAETHTEATITNTWQSLLMEAARIDDERDMQDAAGSDSDSESSINPEKNPLKVLIVDDSSMMCSILKQMLAADETIAVIETAKNGEDALGKIETLHPDLITLDVNMPVMNGSTALKHIMIKSPCPVLVISNPSSRSQMHIFDFLRLGAVDFINKPANKGDMAQQQHMLIQKVHSAAKAEIDRFRRVKLPKHFPPKELKGKKPAPSDHLVIINAGAGGFAELVKLIPNLPQDIQAGIVLLHSLSNEFAASLSDYLNRMSRIPLVPLQEDVPVLKGCCYVGSHDMRLKLKQQNDRFFLCREQFSSNADFDTDHFSGFLHSVSGFPNCKTLVVLLSGAEIGDMEGLTSIKKNNAKVIMQLLDSCVVPFSLEKAFNADLVDLEAGHAEIINHIIDHN